MYVRRRQGTGRLGPHYGTQKWSHLFHSCVRVCVLALPPPPFVIYYAAAWVIVESISLESSCAGDLLKLDAHAGRCKYSLHEENTDEHGGYSWSRGKDRWRWRGNLDEDWDRVEHIDGDVVGNNIRVAINRALRTLRFLWPRLHSSLSSVNWAGKCVKKRRE